VGRALSAIEFERRGVPAPLSESALHVGTCALTTKLLSVGLADLVNPRRLRDDKA
jgi:hypothetical protein